MAIDASTLAVNTAKAREEIMLRQLLDQAKAFYREPKHQKAFEAWLKKRNKEATLYDASSNHC